MYNVFNCVMFNTQMMTDYMFGAALSETVRQHVQFSTVFEYVFEYSSLKNYVPQWRGR